MGDIILKHRHPPLESMAVDVVVLECVRQYAESEKLPPIAYGWEFRISVPRQLLTAASCGGSNWEPALPARWMSSFGSIPTFFAESEKILPIAVTVPRFKSMI